MSACGRPPRLLVYSQDGLGLGHQRRTSLLAAEFLSTQPDASVLTVSDSPIGQFFSPVPGHDYLKLPSIQKVGPGNWCPVSLSMPFTDVLDLRRETIRSVALGFQPDVLLVDHMPHGAMGELVPTLEALESFPVKVILGLRDILDSPATVRQRWHLEGAFEAVERHFHEVFVYGSPDVFDVAAQYAWPAQIRSRLRYCGYVCSPPSRSAHEPIRRRYLRDEPDGKLVVAMAGGGADAFPLFEALLKAVPSAMSSHRCTFVVVTGPFLPAAERVELARLAHGLPVHLIPTVTDSLGYLGAADLVVGMAGYNTTAEILSLEGRAVLVPRSGPSAEQQMRASRFAQRGWVRWLRPELLSSDGLAEAMVRALDAPVEPSPVAPDLGGRQRAAAYLRANLGGAGASSTSGASVERVLPTAVTPGVDTSARLLGEG